MAPSNFKKRKRDSDVQVDTSKPTAIFQPAEGREWTLSVALPSSIILNAQSHDLKTSLAGTIARALAVFCVDEVVIFADQVPPSTPVSTKDHQPSSSRKFATTSPLRKVNDSDDASYTGNTDPTSFMVRLLAYLETPPYLRRALFPLHPDLRTAGTLPSTDMPHHVRAGEWTRFREGVSVEKPATAVMAKSRNEKPEGKAKKKKGKPRAFDDVDAEMAITGGSQDGAQNGTNRSSGTSPRTYVEAGLEKLVCVSADIPPRTRVTLDFGEPTDLEQSAQAQAVHPDTPRSQNGIYWGYSVRAASSLSDVFTECGFPGGYDVSIGTSERGVPFSRNATNSGSGMADELRNGNWRHLLLVFGGVAGLEVALAADEKLKRLGVNNVADMFDYWVNLVPGQGSRTIRTEEAIWVGLMGVRGAIDGYRPSIES